MQAGDNEMQKKRKKKSGRLLERERQWKREQGGIVQNESKRKWRKTA